MDTSFSRRVLSRTLKSALGSVLSFTSYIMLGQFGDRLIVTNSCISNIGTTSFILLIVAVAVHAMNEV